MSFCQRVRRNLADRYGIGTILDDDGGPAGGCPDRSPLIRVQDGCTVEADSGTTLMRFRVVRSGDLSGQSRMNWGTFNGSAVGPWRLRGQVRQPHLPDRPDGQVRAHRDQGRHGAGAHEEVRVPSVQRGGRSAVREGTGTIVDDDGPRPGTCGSAGGTGVRSRSPTPDHRGRQRDTMAPVRCHALGPEQPRRICALRDHAGTAVRGSDYLFEEGTFRFQPGQTEKLTRIKIVGDTQPEANEQFTIKLANPTNASIADSTGVGHIADDD